MIARRLAALIAAAMAVPAFGADKPEAAKPSEAGAARAAATVPAAPEDPVERLRQRLAERLSTGRAASATAPSDLRLSPASSASGADATVSVAPGALRPVRATSATPAAPSKVGGAALPSATASWSYDGAAGPAAWGSLKPEYALCGRGQRQSPIDLRGGLPVDLEPVRFEYQASRFGVIDTGRTLQVNLAPGNHIDIGGRRFALRHIRFHRPAEHRIDGRAFEMTAHLLHEDAQGRIAVVAVLLDAGPALPVVQAVWNHIPLERNEELSARVSIDPTELLPADRRYYTYMGSLTSPPCTEGVQWVVMRTPVTMAAEQIELFARIYPMNARPLQAAAGRRILQSN
jgi:carbonic anhydrase